MLQIHNYMFLFGNNTRTAYFIYRQWRQYGNREDTSILEKVKCVLLVKFRSKTAHVESDFRRLYDIRPTHKIADAPRWYRKF